MKAFRNQREASHYDALQISYQKKLSHYLQQLSPLSGRSALAATDLDTLMGVAHRLAGSGTPYGFAELSRCGRALERACDMARDLPRNLRMTVIASPLEALLHCLSIHSRSDTDSEPAVPACIDSDLPSVGKILLVDDDDEFSANLSAQLSEYGYHVDILDTVYQLDEAITRLNPVAVLVDMDFYGHRFAGAEQVTAWRQEDNAPLPVIFISAFDSFDTRMSAVRAGGNHFLGKPLDVQRLVSLLRTETDLAPTEPYRVLVVDDDTQLLQLYSSVLSDAGYSVFTANQAQDALILLEQERPELVLIDVYMPEVNGIELGQLIRQHEEFAHIPLLFISAAEDTDVQLACARLTNDEFISKPIEPWRLLMVVKSRVSRGRRLHASTARPMGPPIDWTEDAVTALPSLKTFRHALQEALHNLATGEWLAVIKIDIRDFHTINTLYGHQQGNQVLQRLAWDLSHCLNDREMLCRESGDEFLVMSTGHNSTGSISEKCWLLNDVIEQPMSTDKKRPKSLTADLGVAVAPRDAQHADDLLRCADTAMFLAKKSPQSSIQYFKPTMHQDEQSRFKLSQEIKGGLLSGQFTAVYQPILRISDNQIAGFEALVRWNHPEKGVVSPAEFIPIMEKQSLIAELTRHMLSEALHQLALWQVQHPQLFMSVNLSAQDIQTPAFVRHLARLIVDYDLTPTNVVLEITETELLVDWQQAASTLSSLRALGVRLALDDFGTGYSSLSYLNRIQADKLKIDRSFISGASNHRDDKVLLAMITMGQALGMSVIAEGIETYEQLALMKSLGCDYYQGFLTARPMPAREVSFEINS